MRHLKTFNETNYGYTDQQYRKTADNHIVPVFKEYSSEYLSKVQDYQNRIATWQEKLDDVNSSDIDKKLAKSKIKQLDKDLDYIKDNWKKY